MEGVLHSVKGRVEGMGRLGLLFVGGYPDSWVHLLEGVVHFELLETIGLVVVEGGAKGLGGCALVRIGKFMIDHDGL